MIRGRAWGTGERSATWPRLVDDRYTMTTPIWIYWARQRSPAPSAQAFARHIQRALSPGD